MSSLPAARKFVLRSSDGESFMLEGKAAMQSRMIRDMVEDDCPDEVIIVPATGSILAKVMEYCRKHAGNSLNSDNEQAASFFKEELKSWDAEFLKVDLVTIFDLALASHYLNVDDLLNKTCQAADKSLRNKSAKEIREIFEVEDD